MCNCMSEVNEKLREYNTRIEMVFTLGENAFSTRWPISTVQIEKGRGKAKAMRLVASYCPMCGKRLRNTQP